MVGGCLVEARICDGGEVGAGSSHSNGVKFRALCLCIFGGGVGEMGVVGDGYNTVR